MSLGHTNRARIASPPIFFRVAFLSGPRFSLPALCPHSPLPCSLTARVLAWKPLFHLALLGFLCCLLSVSPRLLAQQIYVFVFLAVTSFLWSFASIPLGNAGAGAASDEQGAASRCPADRVNACCCHTACDTLGQGMAGLGCVSATPAPEPLLRSSPARSYLRFVTLFPLLFVGPAFLRAPL